MINEGADFPATRHFPATFAISDEFYQAKAFSPNARVLLRLDVSKMPPHAELRNQGLSAGVGEELRQGPGVLFLVRA